MRPRTFSASHRGGRILLCTDVSYQCYRAAAAHPNLTHDGQFTGGLFGFWISWARAVLDTQATHVAFCLDVKPYVRSTQFPQYKAFRAKNRDDGLKDMADLTQLQVRDTLTSLGFEPWGVQGFESDDLIGLAAMRYRHRFNQIWGNSNDSDLYQLFRYDNFRIYKPNPSGKFDYMDGARLMRAFQLTPEQHALSTALTGTHNDLPGIPKVGPVSALKAIRDPALMRKYREQHGALIDRNIELIHLPHKQLPDSTRLPAMPAPITPRRAMAVFDRFGISMKPMQADAFEQLQYSDAR